MEDEKPTGEAKPEDPKPEEAQETKPPPPQWERRTSFKINDRMKDVVQKTIDLTRMEIASLRRKIDKLTYGS